MKGVRLLMAVFLCALALAPKVAGAQEDNFGSSYLTPFPPGELYNIAVIGDDMADGLQYGLGEALIGDRRLALRAKRHILNGLARPDFAEKLASLEDDLKREPPQIAVVMLGASDRVSLRDPAGKKVSVGTTEWRTDYAGRADRLMKLLKRLNVSVYWVGLPNVRRTEANDDHQMINEVLRERIFLNGMKHIDVYASFLDEQGGFDAYGPDIAGKIVRLRDGDGDFTGAGFRKLAHFVERDLKRDLSQARADRDVPLAGAELEQAKVNPDKAKLAEPAPGAAPKTPAAPGSADGGTAGANAATPAVPADAALGEQKAETGKISLKTVSASGREEILNLDIVRPAIAASVVQLVTRRESADKPAQMGDNLIDQISGGLLIMNSVTPASNTNRNGAPKLSAAQTPYFRVLFKGERLQPKVGRADDASWPRLGSAASLEKTSKAVVPNPPAAPAETGSTEKPDAGTGDAAAPLAPEIKKRKSKDRD